MSTQPAKSSLSFPARLAALVLAFGPGIFAIGYTIGTGSVTSMIVAGSRFGMQLLWVLLLSCFFSGVLIYVFGKFSLITGDTALHAFRKHLKYGRWLAIAILVSVVFGQWNSLMGILGISSNVIYELLALNYPDLTAYRYWIVLGIAVVIISTFYAIMLKGNYTFFEKVLTVFVAIMGFSFLFSLFFVHPLPREVIVGLIPTVPEVAGGKMMVAAFVGTTMAAATFLSRPLFILGKGWTIEDNRRQRNDAIIAAVLVFVISGAIMAVAHGALYVNGGSVDRVLDMADTLEPVAGKFAVTLFFFGTLSAGLSSIFPCMLIAPLLLADYQSGKLDTQSRQFRVIIAIAALTALIGPILGANPIQLQILSQVFNVFALPAVVLGILLLIRQKDLLQNHRFQLWVVVILYVAFFFSCVVSYNGVMALVEAAI